MVKLELRHFNATEETTTMTKDTNEHTHQGKDVLWMNTDADARGWKTNLEGEVRG